jgi:hypothetical protein
MMRLAMAVSLAGLTLCLMACGDDEQKSEVDVIFVNDLPSLDVFEEPDISAIDVQGDLPGPQDTWEPPEDLWQPEPDIPDGPLESCYFNYSFADWQPILAPLEIPPWEFEMEPVDQIAHLDPAAPSTHLATGPGARDDIVMPDFQDNMPLFDRGRDWLGQPRCYELPDGPAMLTEAEAYHLYVDLVEETLLVPFDQSPNFRTVVGLRGSSPGTFVWNGNGPNRFNDTLVLLWREANGTPRVKEFAAHTDTGPHDFGWHNSSSLRPNRHYRYINGWHKNYNALQIVEYGYEVRDDTNKNGHWDSDRNGWLPPQSEGLEDHDRVGSAHNIHCGTVDGPLLAAQVGLLSAGCQVIPGIAGWTEFITHAWTGSGDEVDYFLLDVRDIDSRTWAPCTPDGTRNCPYVVEELPFHASGNTAASVSSAFDQYNCSPANESGPEDIYVFTLQDPATIHATVDDLAPGAPDIDIHLLYGDDASACITRGDMELFATVQPGRYYLVADTYVDGTPLTGPYELDIWLEPVVGE